MTPARRDAREAEFAGFFYTCGPQLRRLAFLMLGDWHLAEDVTQQALYKTYAHWDRSDARRREAFARKILTRECLSMLRRRPPEVLEDGVLESIHESPGPDEPAMTRATFLERVGHLSPQQRAVVALRIYEDLPVSEVAEWLGVTDGTVKSQTARALARLRASAARHSSPGGIDV